MMSMPRGVLYFLLALLCHFSTPALAHKPSDSYLSLDAEDRLVSGRWDIALRDLDMAIGLDADGNGELTWNEVRSKHGEISAYAFSRLSLMSADQACTPKVAGHLIDNHTDGAYAVIRFTAECNEAIETLNIHYKLLFDIDPQHKGLLKLELDGRTSTAIFTPEQAVQQLGTGGAGRFAQFIDYVKHGVWHIWIGFDHILFLLSLLLPAVLVLRNQTWHSSQTFKSSLMDVLKIVTAFTVAHSITLSAASLGFVDLPSRWIESVIAASVVLAALNNLFPVFHGKRWLAAFVFGLVHGFGFASVLTDLGLPTTALVAALVGFNIGVELGQLAIVAAFLPIAFVLRQTWVYQRLVFRAGSVLIAFVAFGWLVERAFDVTIFAG